MTDLKPENDAAITAIRGYEISFILNTDQILGLDPNRNPLEWTSIPFGSQSEEHKLPTDKRGVYAFVITDRRVFLPPHGYIMYIGISGRDSERSLLERYGDYFKQSEIKRRPCIRNMILQWHPLLRFHFAPVGDDVSPAELKAIEQRLITAFLPPCCKEEIEAETREMLATFRR